MAEEPFIFRGHQSVDKCLRDFLEGNVLTMRGIEKHSKFRCAVAVVDVTFLAKDLADILGPDCVARFDRHQPVNPPR
ncbi:MAG: hypothetical protein ACD_75C02178G0003 [uncultured bacterium]|nr:MAG: hypothetical protein ACD_75C02178G0003 [uncultured bacterium]